MEQQKTDDKSGAEARVRSEAQVPTPPIILELTRIARVANALQIIKTEMEAANILAGDLSVAIKMAGACKEILQLNENDKAKVDAVLLKQVREARRMMVPVLGKLHLQLAKMIAHLSNEEVPPDEQA